MDSDSYLKRTEVEIERRVAAPAAEVFRAFTEPSLMSRWMWAGMGGEAWAECDLRVGGAYRVYTKFEGGQHQGEGWSGMCGIYVGVVPDRRLVYTMHWDADVEYNRDGRLTLDEVVSVTLAPEGDGTRLTFVHMGIPDDGRSAGGHRAGDEAALDLLATVVA